jgi:hypothetical protein
MAYQPINLGTASNDGTGDNLKAGGAKLNANFVELYGLKAPLASPPFTGTPTAPTASPGTNTTQLATTGFVTSAIAAQGLGTMATQAASAVAITGGSLSGITSLALAPGANGSPLVASGYSLTGANAQSLLDLSGTWNTSGTPIAIKLNITDTASNAASLLMDLQKGGVSQFSVSRSGRITAAGSMILGASSTLSFSGRSNIASMTDGNIRLTDNTLSSFGLLQFGGITASYPAIKRSTTILQARLADDSAFAQIQGKLTTDTNYTAGTVTPTGWLVLYDGAGNAYRVPCVA